MSVQIRYRLTPNDPWIDTMINREDPFEVCNAVRAKLFPNSPLPERDARFDAMMAARTTGARQGPAKRGVASAAASSGAGASIPLPRAGVRDTSMAAYRSLEWSGKLTGRQKVVVDFLLANRQRDYTRQELADATGMPINGICGRVHELMEMRVLEEVEGGRRECRITRERANVLRLAVEKVTIEKEAA